MPLNDKQFELINFVEQEYLLYGSLPSADRIDELGLASKKYYNEFLADANVRRNLVARGISLRGLDGTSSKAKALTEEQLTVANTLLDLTDNRSKKKKLSDLGVSTQKYEAWLRDAAFQGYIRERAENLLGDSMSEAHLALLDRVKSGDMKALEFFYEITGRYVRRGNENFDLPSFVMKVLEIIQRHVSNDQEVMAVGEALLQLANGASMAAIPARAVDVKVLDAI